MYTFDLSNVTLPDIYCFLNNELLERKAAAVKLPSIGSVPLIIGQFLTTFISQPFWNFEEI